MNAEDHIGRLLAGKYRLEALVGRGGFGAVYRATHEPLGRTVAVKICLFDGRRDLHARFVREAQIQSALRHPSCVTLLDFGEDDGVFYMVQEFVVGRTLSEILEREGPMPARRAVAIVCDVLELADTAHRLGIVHRDLKPGNVMLTLGDDGHEHVRVLDFGIAKIIDDSRDDGVDLTRTGATLGTPSFMAPEQIRRGPIGPGTDIYAIGAMLYRLCAGYGPFVGEVAFDVLRMHLEAPPPRLPFAAPALDRVIAKAMAKAPAARFATAGDMRAALAGIADLDAVEVDRTFESLPTGLLHQASETISAHGEQWRWTESPRGRWGPLIVGALVLLLGIGGAFLAPDAPEPPEPARPAAAAATALVEEAPALVFEVGVVPIAADAGPRVDAAVVDEADAAAAPPAAGPSRKTAGARPPTAERARTRRRRARPAKKKPSVRAAVEADAPPTELRPHVLVGIIERHLLACRCDDVAPLLGRLRGLEPATARPLAARYEDECRARLPNNCLEKLGR